MANKPTQPVFPLGLAAEEQSTLAGVLNTGTIEHGPDAVLTLPEGNASAGLPSSVRYNADSDEFEGFYENGGWLPLGGGGIRWEVLPHASTATLTEGRGYLINNTTGASTVVLPSPTRIGDSVTICDAYGKFATYPLTVSPSGNKLYGSTEDMAITTDNVSATFTWSGPEQGWIITSGVGLGQGRVYSREIFTQILASETSSVALNTPPIIVDVYADGKRLAESKYSLDGNVITFSPSLPASTELQVIEYTPVQLGTGGGSGSSTITWVYNGGSAIGGETEITLDVVVDDVPAIDINGSRQYKNLGFTFDPLTSKISLVQELEPEDEVVVIINGTPNIYNQIDYTLREVARVTNVKDTEVVYFSVGAVLSGYKVIYDKETQRAYPLPADIVPGTTAVSLSSSAVLVHSAGSVDLGELAVSREEYVTLSGSFDTGVTVNTKNELVVFTDGKYRWDGVLPKEVSAGSTPSTTGGIGLGKWVSVGDASLRSELSKSDGFLLIGGLKETFYRTFDNIQIMKSDDNLKDGDVVSTKGFYTKGDLGGSTYRITASATADGCNVIALDNGLFAVNTKTRVRIQELGVVDNPSVDQSAIFNTAMSYAGGEVIIDGISILLTATVTVARSMHCVNGGKLITTSSTYANIVRISKDNGFFTLNIDANKAACMPVRVTGNGNKFTAISITGLYAPSGSGTGVIGVQFQGSNNVVDSIVGSDCVNTGNTNASMPQLFMFYDGSKNNYIGSVYASGCCSILNSAQDIEVTVGRMYLVDCQDNGIYGGGRIHVDYFHYDGSEEAIAGSSLADLTITYAEVGGEGLGAVSYADMTRMSIDHLHIFRGTDGDTPKSVVNARTVVTTAGVLSIGRLTGEIEGVRLFSCDKGMLNQFILGACDILFVYNASRMNERIADIRNVRSFRIGDMSVRFWDKGNALASTSLNVPFDFPVSPSAPSTLNSLNFIGLMVDQATPQPNVTFQGRGLRNSNVYVRHGLWQTNIGPYLREMTYSLGYNGDNGIQQTPTTGYWRKGEDFALINATAAPFRLRCTVSGTPGTFVAY